jgi:hypothetical protein
MRVRTTYTATPANALTDADLPIEVTIEDVTLSLNRDEHDELRLVVERPVDRSALAPTGECSGDTRTAPRCRSQR